MTSASATPPCATCARSTVDLCCQECGARLCRASECLDQHDADARCQDRRPPLGRELAVLEALPGVAIGVALDGLLCNAPTIVDR